MKLFILVIFFFVLALFLYSRITTITFEDDQARISRLYCSLSKSPSFSDPVIFVPGIKGSLLEKNGSLVWLGKSQLVRNTEPLQYTEGDGVAPRGIFTKLAIIPYFFEYRPYFRMTALLACNPSTYVFSYDWRDYPQNNLLRFEALVERVTKETGKKPSVIAHSMGGLIVHGFVKKHSSLIDKVVYVSVPFNPGIGYFDDINEGVSVGLNTKLLSRDAILSHPASFLLLPHNGSNHYEGHELMDARVWQRNKWSVFADGGGDVSLVQKMMDKVSEYHRLLDTPKKLANPFMIVTSDCHKTVFGMNSSGRTYLPGDGRVPQISSFPFDELSHKDVFVSCAKHDAQMDDKEIVEKIIEFLNTKE